MKDKAKKVVRQLRREIQQPKWRRSKSIRWMIGIVLTLALASLFPRTHYGTLSGYSVGTLWTSEPVTAPFSYPLYKDPAQYRKEIGEALISLYPIYLPDSTARLRSLDSLKASWTKLVRILPLAKLDSLEELSYNDSLHLPELAREDFKTLVDNSAVILRNDETLPVLLKLANDIENAYDITATDPSENIQGGNNLLSVRTRPNEEIVISRDSLYSLSDLRSIVAMKLEERFKHDPLLRPLTSLVHSALQPNLRYSPEKTEESRQALINQIPRTDGIVVEGSQIVSKGEIVTPGVKASLESLSRAKLERGGIWAQIGRVVGTIGHAGIIILLIVLYFRFIRRKIYKDNAQLLLVAMMLFFPSLLAYLTVHIQAGFPLEYLILIPVTSMLLTILFDSRTGFYGTVIVALLVAGIRGNDYAVALASLTAGAFAAYTVHDLRSRGQLFQSIWYIFIGYLVSILALSLEKSTPLLDMGAQLVAALGNALISPVLTFGLLYVVETVFDTVSDLRLTEYDNINQPLLRELALRAPGTYQHTMLVAQLSENAAMAIGANALLAKVGAFFHDIGKLVEPSNFIENQKADAANIHDSISPVESAERVRAHVLEGIELGRAHHLPEKILEFIPMHHGTLAISFFQKQAEEAGIEIEDPSIFRYPGPKPATKETAIVMLADASEAVARSLATLSAEPTAEMIEGAIVKLIQSRFEDGQLDNSDLTIRDLTIVSRVFSRLLAAMHHSRINYPAPPAETEVLAEVDASSSKA